MKKNTQRKIWAWFMRLGNRCGCHQREDRSFKIGEFQFPVCSRCTGILLGQIISIRIKESTNLRRLLTGTLAGIAQINIIYQIIIYIIKLF